MKYSVLFLGILPFSAIISAARDAHRLTAVSDNFIAEDLYNRIRDGSPDTEPPPEMFPDDKNRICYHIANSASFLSAWPERQVFIHKVYRTLILKDPELFLSLYEINRNADLVYTNRTKPIDVYNSEEATTTVRDYAFMCLTTAADEDDLLNEDDDTNHIDKNYISKEYNLSDDPTASHIAGRFLFRYRVNNPERLEIISLAEEPAESLSNPGEEVERLYLENRKGTNPEENADGGDKGSICLLSLDERLRLCTIVLSSPFFEGELKFVPDYKYVDKERCFRKQISFRDERIKEETVGKVYEDWLIRCIPEQRYATFQAEYFISRVHNSKDKAFVYRWDKGPKIVIENQFGSVRFSI